MIRLLVALCLGVLFLSQLAAAVEPKASAIRFNRDIRPILADNCFVCHGHDVRRKAGLRLDTRPGATAELRSGSGRAVVPGDVTKSVLVERITATDPDRRMPPPKTKKTLTPQQVDLLRRWVAEGAKYEGHWAFTAAVRPEVPRAVNPAWARNPIDRFILARLEQEGLTPATEAPSATLLRRVTLALTGLPPTAEEVTAFVADKAPAAYDRAVDRLLASPRFGEHLASQWLDLARYADTNGYNNDEERTMWPWRDWVIDAFNRNLPYDWFLTEQLAGDLLPGATVAQKLATGFNRNHVITTEGGIFPEEYRVEYVADRVHTTASVFLGLSLQCARCHDHKYDPFTTKDYYRFFAFFNNIEDQTVGYNAGAAARPYMKAPSPRQQAELARIEQRLATLAQRLRQREAEVDRDLAAWEKTGGRNEALSGLVVHFPLDEGKGNVIQGVTDKSHQAKIKGPPKWAAGKINGALELDGQSHVDAGALGALERTDAFSIAAWVYPASKDGMAILSKMDEAAAYRGYDLLLEAGKLVVHLIHHWPDNGLKVSARESLSLNAWHHVLVTYDGSSTAAGLKVYVDGQPQALDVHTDRLTDTIRTEQPLRLGLRTKSLGFKGRLDDVRFYRLALGSADAVQLVKGGAVTGLADVLKIPAERRSAAHKQLLRKFYVDSIDEVSHRLRAQVRELTAERAAVEKNIPLAMVMAEMATPRKTYILKRGQYDAPGVEVTARALDNLLPTHQDVPANRLGLARWLTDPRHPLTARVAVNRWWEMLFGTGLVETSEDFGTQGASPSHPELLDWCATELVRSSWDVKAMLRLMVTSATYRQASHLTAALHEKDPRNRLLARGPRVRFPAETVRDNALAVSGLLRDRIGGPSVKPYQPAGLWEDVSVERRAVYKADAGDGLYRRSLYTYWKRTCPPPGMTALDAPDRETCTVRRARTNTPLQALLLLNDPTYLEAARKLAERIMREGGPSVAQRLDRGCLLAIARGPAPGERQVLEAVYRKALTKFRTDPKATGAFLASGQSPVPSSLDLPELAAWTVVASTMLNLDEAITRE
jgi:hypothetical protein